MTDPVLYFRWHGQTMALQLDSLGRANFAYLAAKFDPPLAPDSLNINGTDFACDDNEVTVDSVVQRLPGLGHTRSEPLEVIGRPTTGRVTSTLCDNFVNAITEPSSMQSTEVLRARRSANVVAESKAYWGDCRTITGRCAAASVRARHLCRLAICMPTSHAS